MRKLKLLSLMLVLALSIQTSVFAADTVNTTVQDNTTKSATVQPRGVYLQGGGCTISPYYNCNEYVPRYPFYKF